MRALGTGGIYCRHAQGVECIRIGIVRQHVAGIKRGVFVRGITGTRIVDGRRCSICLEHGNDIELKCTTHGMLDTGRFRPALKRVCIDRTARAWDASGCTNFPIIQGPPRSRSRGH